MIPETDQELIGEIRMLNASIDVDEQDIAKKRETREAYLIQLGKSLGSRILRQLAGLKMEGKLP